MKEAIAIAWLTASYTGVAVNAPRKLPRLERVLRRFDNKPHITREEFERKMARLSF